MREHLGFLRVSSIVVKLAAWFFLLLGVVGAISINYGFVPGYPRWMSIVVLAIYGLLFFVLYIIAKIAELLMKIINFVHKEGS